MASLVLRSRFLAAPRLWLHLPVEQQDAYWMSGFALTYRGNDDKWTVSAYIDNIEDKEVVNATFPHPFAGDLFAAALRPPRTYGARLRVNF